MEPLGCALVGLDHWYNAFPMAEAIQASDKSVLRWVVGAVPQRAEAVARKYGARHYTTEYEDALRDPSVEAVVCFVSADRSADICVAAAEAGKHIISIKPVATTLEQADRVVQSVHDAGVKYLPGGCSHLFFASHQQFKEWIDGGRIGRLISAQGVFHAGLPRSWPDTAEPGWFVDPMRVPGGAWIDHAIFFVQLFRWLFGAEIVEVAGKTANLKYPELPVEDYGQAICTFANGAIVTMTSTWIGAPGAHSQSLELFGSEGTLVWNSLLNKIAVTGHFDEEFNGWVQMDRPAEPVSRTFSMLEHFVDCVRQDRAPVCDVEDDRANLAASLAFYEAAATGSSVRLAPTP